MPRHYGPELPASRLALLAAPPDRREHDLVLARPDLVQMQVFDVARHTKLWNYDQARWSETIRSWLIQQGLAAPEG